MLDGKGHASARLMIGSTGGHRAAGGGACFCRGWPQLEEYQMSPTVMLATLPLPTDKAQRGAVEPKPLLRAPSKPPSPMPPP